MLRRIAFIVAPEATYERLPLAFFASASGSEKIGLPLNRTSPDVAGMSCKNHLAQRRLATTGLAHQAERLAAPHVERDAVDRADRSRYG